MYMKDPTKLKPKSATHLDLFLDQCLSSQLGRQVDASSRRRTVTSIILNV